jgi:malate dehydrogenase (oxaloacetate-decarboxylating)
MNKKEEMKKEALKLHLDKNGKISVVSKVPVKDEWDLSLAYSPGVAEPCREIVKDEDNIYKYTSKGNVIAVVSDGSAVLGLGNIGAKASLPVMEGKAVLFKSFADVDAFPICLDCQDVDSIVETVKLLEPTFGGVNLEDIAAPKCFEVEERLKRETSIPIFHDDQHGTAIIATAGLINSLKIVGKKLEEIKIVINGTGAAGVSMAKLLLSMGVNDLVLCDSRGIIYKNRQEGMNKYKEELAEITNKEVLKGNLANAMKGADVFMGVSVANVVSSDMVKSMKNDSIIFAMANPDPEILPEDAKKAGARIIGTGRSDYPNQVNNVLAFPGIFRGALDVRASDINEEMKIAAVHAIANIVSEEEMKDDYVIPKPFDPRVGKEVAAAVAKAAQKSGVARI